MMISRTISQSRLSWLLLIIYCALIYWESSQAKAPVPDFGFQWQDKVYHLCGYALFAALCYWAFASLDRTAKRAGALCVLTTALYGASDELHQFFVPGRSSEIGDWLADVCGALLVVSLVYLRTRVKRRTTVSTDT